MTTRKFAKRNIRKNTKVGKTSLAVTLPVEFMKALAWRDGQRVVIKRKGAQLIISDWKSRKGR